MKILAWAGVALLATGCASRLPWSADAAGLAYDSGRGLAEVPNYTVQGDCDGFPRVADVKTAPGLCLGLVDKNEGRSVLAMRKPRAIAAYQDDLLLTDMDGWGRRQGRVFLLKKQPDGKYLRFLLLDAEEFPRSQRAWLYMPSSVQVGPDGLAYVGATSSILRFDPMTELFDGATDTNPTRSRQREIRRQVRATVELVLDALPYRAFADPSEDSLHPLKPFIFDAQWNMYIGVGASTDNCEPHGRPDERCPESDGTGATREGAHAKLLRSAYDPTTNTYAAPVAYAWGLRNAMAMAFHPLTGELYQGENSHDKRDESHLSRLGPADELNIVREGEFYGWPYCVEFNKETPPYAGGGWNCAQHATPELLLPPHGAPLAMLFYTGTKLPEWYRNKVIMPLHSAEPFAHRLITFDVDANQRPVGRPLNLIWNWEANAQSRRAFNGFPFGVAQASDGSIFITEDKNQTILRLSTTSSEPGVTSEPPPPWTGDDEWMLARERQPAPPRRDSGEALSTLLLQAEPVLENAPEPSVE